MRAIARGFVSLSHPSRLEGHSSRSVGTDLSTAPSRARVQTTNLTTNTREVHLLSLPLARRGFFVADFVFCFVCSSSQPQQQPPRQPRQPAWSNANAGVAAVAPSSSSSTAASVSAAAPPAHAAPSRSLEEQKAEFDFQSSNARFDKRVVQQQEDATVPSYDLPSTANEPALGPAGFPVVVKKYDKTKSFFDGLTTGDKSSTGAGPHQQERPTTNRRQVDQDTFGAEAAQYRSQHGRGRGGRRGGRGGNRQPQQQQQF